MTFYDVVQCPVEFDTDKGKISVIDGFAAGGSWILVEFLDGPYVGRKLWMNNDENSAEYRANCSDDGMVFNVDPKEPSDGDVAEGGEFDPSLEMMTITIK